MVPWLVTLCMSGLRGLRLILTDSTVFKITHSLQLNEKFIFLSQDGSLLLVNLLASLFLLEELLSQFVQLFFFLPELVFTASHVEEGLDLGVQPPPLPVAEEEVFTNVLLKHSKGQSRRVLHNSTERHSLLDILPVVLIL